MLNRKDLTIQNFTQALYKVLIGIWRIKQLFIYYWIIGELIIGLMSTISFIVMIWYLHHVYFIMRLTVILTPCPITVKLWEDTQSWITELHVEDYLLEDRNKILGLRVLASRVSFWHPGPWKMPIFGGKDTISFGQNFLKISITSRYLKKFNS